MKMVDRRHNGTYTCVARWAGVGEMMESIGRRGKKGVGEKEEDYYEVFFLCGHDFNANNLYKFVHSQLKDLRKISKTFFSTL